MKVLLILSLMTVFVSSCGSRGSLKEEVKHAKMEATSHSKLDDLIRGEMAAIETYTQVIGKVKDQNEKRQLTAMRDDHRTALSKLQSFANQPVKDDAKDSGAWGMFAKAWTGGAKVFGEESAVRALRQGEEHGLREYERLLQDEKVSSSLKDTVRTQLMPKQQEHIKTLSSQI